MNINLSNFLLCFYNNFLNHFKTIHISNQEFSACFDLHLLSLLFHILIFLYIFFAILSIFLSYYLIVFHCIFYLLPLLFIYLIIDLLNTKYVFVIALNTIQTFFPIADIFILFFQFLFTFLLHNIY